MKIDCISDLHGWYPQLVGGDLLIIAGDLTARHTEKEFYEFSEWAGSQDYDNIIVIAGNHDAWLEKASKEKIKDWSDFGSFTYLCDSGVEMVTQGNRLKIWGSPWSPLFKEVNPKCMAFMKEDRDLFDQWEMIPAGS